MARPRPSALQASIVLLERWNVDLARRLAGEDGLDDSQEYRDLQRSRRYYAEKQQRWRNTLLEAGLLLLQQGRAYLAHALLAQAALFTTSPVLLGRIRRSQKLAAQIVSIQKKMYASGAHQKNTPSVIP